MTDWKLRQYLYHTCFKLDDCLDMIPYIVDTNPNNIDKTVCEWFLMEPEITVYPYKSFFVSTVYSICASHYFGHSPKYYLCDKDFLYNNDPFYHTYDMASYVYDNIFEYIDLQQYNVVKETRGLTPNVRDYFLKEFLIEVSQ